MYENKAADDNGAMVRKRAIENEVLGRSGYGGSDLRVPTPVGSQQPIGGVDAAMRRLEERIARLDAITEAVQQRFAPVVAAEPPSTAREGRNGAATGSMSALGNSLEAYGSRLEGITDRLHSLVQRCEL